MSTRRNLEPSTLLPHVLLLRHAGFCLSVSLAYLLRQSLPIGDPFLWMAGVCVLLNLGVDFLPGRRAFAPLIRTLSSLIGILSWSLLSIFSGGADSPLIFGLGLEILLSVCLMSARGTALVTGGVIAGLWGQMLLVRDSPGAIHPRLVILSIVLLCMGAITTIAVWRWCAQRNTLRRQSENLTQRVGRLERELEDIRPLSQLGEEAAQFAHSLKNAVFNLRGYCELLEAKHFAEPQYLRALSGLKQVVDHLERTVVTLLRPLKKSLWAEATGEEVCRAIESALQEVSARHPRVRWSREGAPGLSRIRLSPDSLKEILLVLAQNAAEAVNGRGEVHLVSSMEQGELRIDLSDDGPGIARSIASRLFRPGTTTKSFGSGVGLFLAKRIVESHGGTLIAKSEKTRGATFILRLPTGSP